MNKVHFLKFLFLCIGLADVQASICPLSKGAVVALSGGIGLYSGALTKHMLNPSDGEISGRKEEGSSIRKVAPFAVFGFVSGVLFKLLSHWTPEGQYTEVEKVFSSFNNDPLMAVVHDSSRAAHINSGDVFDKIQSRFVSGGNWSVGDVFDCLADATAGSNTITSEAFFNEVEARFSDVNWPLVDAYEFISDALTTINLSSEVVLNIVKECSGDSYKKLREDCGNLSFCARGLEKRAKKALRRLSEHELFECQKGYKQKFYERERAEAKCVTE